jgi:hypothetical protein
MKIIEFKTTKELQVEKKRAYNIQYKIDNKERLIQYRIDNKEAIAKSRAKYRIKNKEQINAWISQYKKDNKGAINNINARRRARLVSSTPSYSNKEKIKAICSIDKTDWNTTSCRPYYPTTRKTRLRISHRKQPTNPPSIG